MINIKEAKLKKLSKRENQITITLLDNDKQELSTMCATNGASMSKLVALLVREFLDEQKDKEK